MTNTKGSDVAIKDLNTGELLRMEKPKTDKELKAIINGGKVHPNSIINLIKDNPELLKLYQENRTKYLEDWSHYMAQLSSKNTMSFDHDLDS